eukprot:9460438-Pyramimonas_sp.AAC.1
MEQTTSSSLQGATWASRPVEHNSLIPRARSRAPLGSLMAGAQMTELDQSECRRDLRRLPRWPKIAQDG